MLIEYKIKFVEGGIIVTQRVENSAEPPEAIPDEPGERKLLARRFDPTEGDSEAQPPPPPPPSNGTNGGGTTIIIFSTAPGPHGKGPGG